MPHIYLLLLFLLVLTSSANAQQDPVFIGRLSTLQHDVSGDLYAIDTRTLRVDNFVYDGTGPAGVFWLDTVPSATSTGRIIAFNDTCEASPKLSAYTGETVTLQLPADLTLSDVRYFSVWCRDVAVEFGGLEIPESIVSQVLDSPVASCADPDASEMSALFPVQDGWNCEPMSPDFQARWRISDEDNEIQVELVSRTATGTYVGFGPSGSDTGTEMVGSDVVIAHYNTTDEKFSIVDYHMSAQAQCSAGAGVCPDNQLAVDPGVDSLSDISAEYESDVARFTYTRPLLAVDSVDRNIVTEGESYITWAIGPFASGEPNFHVGSTNYPQQNVMVEWGRAASNACPAFSPSSGNDDEAEVPGFVRPSISNVTKLTARIGPSGGARGVSAISGGDAWGIAWYLSPTGTLEDDILIPVLAVERGETYTFTVYGGKTEESNEVHPFYITNNAQGGYAKLTPKERLNERLYAGIDVVGMDDDGINDYTATAEGSLCKLTTAIINTENSTWNAYKESLNFSCQLNESITNGGVNLTWTVPMDAEDIVYYQCVTHRFLGFKIAVFDQGNVNETLLNELSGGAALNQIANDEEEGNCTVTFQGRDVDFNACELEKFEPLHIYYNIGDDGESVDTLFRVSRGDSEEYAAFGWGYDSMIVGQGSNVVVALIGNGTSEPTISNFNLTARTSSGVIPTSLDEYDNMLVDVNDDFITARFTRLLNSDSLPSVSIDGNTPFIWASGKIATSPSLQRHAPSASNRGVGSINLSAGSSSLVSSTRLNRLRVHGILMTITWSLLIPLGILSMRFLKRWSPAGFYLHASLNTIAVCVSIAAFVLAVVYSKLEGSAHRFLGYVVFGLSLLQAFAGYARPKIDAGKIRDVWYGLHAGLGMLTFIAAVVNLFLGVGLGLLGYQTVWYAVIGASVGFYVCLGIILSLFPKTFPTVRVVTESERLAQSQAQEEGLSGI